MTQSDKKRKIRATTLADVGREAGVSAMAASAVLNSSRTSSRISETTRRKILEAAKRLDYRPNVAARALVNRRMNTLGVTTMMPWGDELNHYFLEVFNGIMEVSMQKKQNTTVFTIPDWKDFEKVASFCDGRIDGMILVGPLVDEDVSEKIPRNTPFVALHANHPVKGLINLESDEEHGAYEMVTHLVKLGHRRIMHVSGPMELLGSQRRLEGYRRALKDADIPEDESLILHSDFSMTHAREIFGNWMDRHAPAEVPDAIFCINDAIAMACMEVLIGRKFRVPQDVSVCGFDDSLVARSAHLTSVRQPLREMGNEAVRVLLDLIEGNRVENRNEFEPPIVFNTELALRNSVAPRIPNVRGGS